jgi:hypothetical protein
MTNLLFLSTNGPLQICAHLAQSRELPQALPVSSAKQILLNPQILQRLHVAVKRDPGPVLQQDDGTSSEYVQ